MVPEDDFWTYLFLGISSDKHDPYVWHRGAAAPAGRARSNIRNKTIKAVFHSASSQPVR
jgi:hypothetical protein